ncbi:AAA family ATPase [Aquamicrobium soli]|uniref:AAA family ATPase n=1 Tax=Aquamicrobium soli TaxID=1811518 RepID=A0ABV7KBB8_9HYPH
MAQLNWKAPAHSPDSPLAVARAYIHAGVAVFPCREQTVEDIDPDTGEFVTFVEKRPYTSNGLNGATKSQRIIDIWFGDRHPTALIGIPTGENLGGWVLDLDRHGDPDGNVRDGHAWLAEMEALHGSLLDTARATTANGGTHIFFKHVDGVRNRAAIAPGVDTRGSGGYIVAPGSVMADGRRYEWLDHDGFGLPDFADAPQWLLDLVVAKEPAPQPAPAEPYRHHRGENTVYVERAVEAECNKAASAPVGERGQQLFASACALGEFVAAGALSRGDAENMLMAAATSSGVLAKDGERSTRNRIKRGLDKTQNSPRQIPEPSYSDNDNWVAPEAMSRFIENTRVKKEAANKPANIADEPAQVSEESTQTSDSVPATNAATQATQPKKRERFEKTWFDDIVETAAKETIVKGVLGEREFTTLSGLPGTGKSVIVTDMACHIAAGMEWHGRKIKRGLVVYVAAERKKLTERRMMAFRKYHKVHDVPLLVVGGRLDFTRNLDDAKALISLVKEAEIETGQPCVLIIIDTLTRVFGAGDQNASKDMVKFVQSCDEMLASTQAHVLAIHHTAWSGERGKGAIDLDGAVDASFMVKKDHGKYKLVCDGTNDGEEGDILAFTMESVEIGVDEDGEPTTAPVVVKSVETKMKTSAEAQKGKNARGLEILVELLNRDGVDPESPGYPEGAMVVELEAWKNAIYEDAGETMSMPAKNKRWHRIKKELQDEGAIDFNATWVWAIPTTET